MSVSCAPSWPSASPIQSWRKLRWKARDRRRAEATSGATARRASGAATGAVSGGASCAASVGAGSWLTRGWWRTDLEESIGRMATMEKRPAPEPEPSGREREVDADARALASVVRIRILRLCLDQALTNKEIAERLGRDPGTIYHPVRTLAERGFLEPQPERRGPRGSREVPYLATRKSWRTPLGPSGFRVLVETFLEEL